MTMTISYHHSLPLHGKPSLGVCMLGQDRAIRLSELGVDESPDTITIRHTITFDDWLSQQKEYSPDFNEFSRQVSHGKAVMVKDEVWYYAGVNDGFAMYARERGEES